MKLPLEYFQQEDVLFLARDLIGKVLFSYDSTSQTLTGGRIVETEAYGGITDKASHAYGGRRTRRTEVMYAPGGVAYLYLCYGLYTLLNIVTGKEGDPHAVLIRAIEPLHGIEAMLARRHVETLTRKVAGGPGLLSQALGLSLSDNGASLLGPRLWVEEGEAIDDDAIIASPRVGVAYAQDHAHWPWRLRLHGSSWTSIAK